MKILLTADPFVPVPPLHYGGIERIVASLALHLRRRGHSIGLVAHPDSTVAVDYFAPWPCADPSTMVQHLRNAASLARACAEFSPAVVHSFSRLAYLAAMLARRIPKVMSYQRHTGGRQIRIAAALAGPSLQFTACSEFIANMGRRAGGRWRAVHNFVDTDFYTPADGVADDAPLVFLSRVEPIKGTHVAIGIAKASGRRLTIAGNHATSGADGAYWSDAIAPELGRNGIDYIGPVDDGAKLTLLRSAAALIVPIQWDEPFGIVFAEALACGTPVISCARGALPEIVRPGIDGFLVRDVEEGRRAVAGLGAISRAECRRRAETMFSAERVVPQYESIYSAMADAA